MTNHSPIKSVLLLGGSGFVGRHVCAKLAQAQVPVTVATRRLTHARAVQTLPLVTLAPLNVHDEVALTRCVADHSAVVNLVAVLHGNQDAFEHAHVQLPEKIARACAAANVRRLVHVSALGAALDAPSMYQRSKARGEAVLQSANLALTVLRPSVVFGAEDQFLNLFARLQRFLPVMPLAGANTRFQPVWVEDLAQGIVNSLLRRTASGERLQVGSDQTFEACGPGVFTLRQLVQLAGRLSGANAGQGRPVLALPAALAQLQATVMEMLPGAPLMSRDNLASLQVDNIATGRLPGLDALGIATAALEAVAPGYLGAGGASGPRSNLLAMRTSAGRF
ncbi:MAG: complex I NDUFA9 subunit family protein [Burkholderiales bacterium]